MASIFFLIVYLIISMPCGTTTDDNPKEKRGIPGGDGGAATHSDVAIITNLQLPFLTFNL